jgi:hypothetical protein
MEVSIAASQFGMNTARMEANIPMKVHGMNIPPMGQS